METKANHVLIGAFTILITVLAVLFALWAANYSSSKQWDQYEVVFSESVTGLAMAASSSTTASTWAR
jgi:phospholipid/cholesterol/gamma-HCH transport system substrate-binding protein